MKETVTRRSKDYTDVVHGIHSTHDTIFYGVIENLGNKIGIFGFI